MRNGFLGSLLVLVVGAALVPAQEPAKPRPASDSPSPASSTPASRGTLSFDPGDVDSIPWNPPVGHANVWPYPEPLSAGNPDCGPPGEFWLRAEYLLWFVKGLGLPPLATSGSTVLLGGSRLDPDVFSGGHFTAGTWLNDDHTWGFEGSYFFLGEQTNRFDAASPGSPVLARPFTNVLTGQPGALLVAAPGIGAGTVHASASTILQGAEANEVCALYCCPRARVEVYAGFRYQDLSEELSIRDAGFSAADDSRLAGRRVAVVDQFNTRNVFFGGQFGARAEYQWGRLVASLKTNLALGANTETIHNTGVTIALTGRRPPALPGGLLALPGNSGRFHDSEFTVIPEVGLQLGYQFTPYVRAFVGYDFLYWSDVARPGDQASLGLNPAQVPVLRPRGLLTAPTPLAFSPRETDFWAQGLNVGVEVRY